MAPKLAKAPLAFAALLVALISTQDFSAVVAFTANVPLRPQLFGVAPLLTAQENLSHQSSSSSTALFAKKKNNAKLAALEALEALEETVDVAEKVSVVDTLLDEPLSMKEQMELQKKQKKMQKKQQAAAAEENGHQQPDAKAMSKKEEMLAKALENEESEESEEEKPSKPMSQKELKLMKALEMDELENSSSQDDAVSDEPKLSKKELKALQKKEEKMAAKLAAKQAKKQGNQQEMEEDGVNGSDKSTANGEVRLVFLSLVTHHAGSCFNFVNKTDRLLLFLAD